jgi:hypothetical protein
MRWEKSLTLHVTRLDRRGFACEARARLTELAYLPLSQVARGLRKRSPYGGSCVSSGNQPGFVSLWKVVAVLPMGSPLPSAFGSG